MSRKIIAYFTLAQTAKLTGLPTSTLIRWDREGVYRPARALENRRRPISRLYNFHDIVSLRTLARARSLGVSSRQLRDAGKLLAELPDTSWASTTFYVYDRNLFFEHDEALVAARPYGQIAIREIVEIPMREIQANAEREVQAMAQRTAEQLGATEVNRHIMGGAEVFAGTRVPVQTIVQFVEDGWDDDRILENFPRLTTTDIDVARARAAELALAS